MSDLPLFLFAFANDEEKSLNLSKEIDGINKIFLNLDLTRKLDLKIVSKVKRDQLFTIIGSSLDRLTLFHYGGHANGTKLDFIDGNAIGEGIAKLLQKARNLQLVFLNGCSTVGHVNKLIDLKIKRVIATSTDISDSSAIDFAIKFYEILVNQGTIDNCYHTAITYLETIGKSHYRNIGSFLENRNNNEPVWGIYPEKVPDNWSLIKLEKENFQINMDIKNESIHITKLKVINELYKEKVIGKKSKIEAESKLLKKYVDDDSWEDNQ